MNHKVLCKLRFKQSRHSVLIAKVNQYVAMSICFVLHTTLLFQLSVKQSTNGFYVDGKPS